MGLKSRPRFLSIITSCCFFLCTILISFATRHQPYIQNRSFCLDHSADPFLTARAISETKPDSIANTDVLSAIYSVERQADDMQAVAFNTDSETSMSPANYVVEIGSQTIEVALLNLMAFSNTNRFEHLNLKLVEDRGREKEFNTHGAQGIAYIPDFVADAIIKTSSAYSSYEDLYGEDGPIIQISDDQGTSRTAAIANVFWTSEEMNGNQFGERMRLFFGSFIITPLSGSFAFGGYGAFFSGPEKAFSRYHALSAFSVSYQARHQNSTIVVAGSSSDGAVQWQGANMTTVLDIILGLIGGTAYLGIVFAGFFFSREMALQKKVSLKECVLLGGILVSAPVTLELFTHIVGLFPGRRVLPWLVSNPWRGVCFIVALAASVLLAITIRGVWSKHE